MDTHALVWWVENSARLSRDADAAIRNPDNEVFVSAVSAFEIAQKHRLGKLPSAARMAKFFDEEVAAERFLTLAISTADARLAGAMPYTHHDPFDRMLIAQALLNDMTLVSREQLFDDFGVERLW